MINSTDIKVYLLNITTLIISYSNLIEGLKLLAICVSIGYTIHKWYLMAKKK
jgi:hypothetical protein